MLLATQEQQHAEYTIFSTYAEYAIFSKYAEYTQFRQESGPACLMLSIALGDNLSLAAT
jgi:hypothetical protein